MNFEELARDPFLVFRLGGNFYALSALYVKTMTEIPDIVPIPGAPGYVRGVINLRGSILSLTDLRTRLGLASIDAELSELLSMLEAREKDHINWLDTLERSIVKNEKFTLQLDPHLCGFGKWYYSYTPADKWVGSILAKFEEPHNAIHRLATHVKKLQADGRTEEAKQKLEATKKNELAVLLQLFRQLQKQISDSMRDICIVLETEDRTAAFSVDAVESTEEFDADSFQKLDAVLNTNGELMLCLAKRKKDDTVVTVLNPLALVGVEE